MIASLQAENKQLRDLVTLLGNQHVEMIKVCNEAEHWHMARTPNVLTLSTVVASYREWKAKIPHVEYKGIGTIEVPS
jgi:hypothetical protein